MVTVSVPKVPANETKDKIVLCENRDVLDYAKKIGIDLLNEQHLLYIAEHGVNRALPPDWKCCNDGDQLYYFNFITGETKWMHPSIEDDRLKVIHARSLIDPAMENFDRTSILRTKSKGAVSFDDKVREIRIDRLDYSSPDSSLTDSDSDLAISNGSNLHLISANHLQLCTNVNRTMAGSRSVHTMRDIDQQSGTRNLPRLSRKISRGLPLDPLAIEMEQTTDMSTLFGRKSHPPPLPDILVDEISHSVSCNNDAIQPSSFENYSDNFSRLNSVKSDLFDYPNFSPSSTTNCSRLHTTSARDISPSDRSISHSNSDQLVNPTDRVVLDLNSNANTLSANFSLAQSKHTIDGKSVLFTTSTLGDSISEPCDRVVGNILVSLSQTVVGGADCEHHANRFVSTQPPIGRCDIFEDTRATLATHTCRPVVTRAHYSCLCDTTICAHGTACDCSNQLLERPAMLLSKQNPTNSAVTAPRYPATCLDPSLRYTTSCCTGSIPCCTGSKHSTSDNEFFANYSGFCETQKTASNTNLFTQSNSMLGSVSEFPPIQLCDPSIAAHSHGSLLGTRLRSLRDWLCMAQTRHLLDETAFVYL